MCRAVETAPACLNVVSVTIAGRHAAQRGVRHHVRHRGLHQRAAGAAPGRLQGDPHSVLLGTPQGQMPSLSLPVEPPAVYIVLSQVGAINDRSNAAVQYAEHHVQGECILNIFWTNRPKTCSLDEGPSPVYNY